MITADLIKHASEIYAESQTLMLTSPYLLSLDLEDIRFRTPDGWRFKPRLPEIVEILLRFLAEHKLKITFFTVGDVARAFPGLVATIAAEGHELACHSDIHSDLKQMNPESLARDLERNLESLKAAGAREVLGYRAPYFSITPATTWTYRVLAKLGFKYSSSVLPAVNPIAGWPGFGSSWRLIEGVVELPISLLPWRGPTVPFAGGVYFRTLPFWLIRLAFRNLCKQNRPIVGYFHPYDFDCTQEYFLHPDIGKNYFYNFLLYYNRRTTLKRLGSILKLGFRSIPYHEFVAKLMKQSPVSEVQAAAATNL